MNTGFIRIPDFSVSCFQIVKPFEIWSGFQMVVYIRMAICNIVMVIKQPSHSNTGLFCPVFRCHSKTRPFANRTTFDHLNTGLVPYSDGYCIRLDIQPIFDSVVESIFDSRSSNSTTFHQIYSSALTRLRSQTFSICIDDESWVGTPLRRNLLEVHKFWCNISQKSFIGSVFVLIKKSFLFFATTF